jgi:hypothetical protein
MQQERHRGFFEFFQRYPDAERHEQLHSNGYRSTISVGLFSGEVDAAFIGVYKADGSLRSEENLPLDILEGSFGRNLHYGLLLSELTKMAVDKAGAAISS